MSVSPHDHAQEKIDELAMPDKLAALQAARIGDLPHAGGIGGAPQSHGVQWGVVIEEAQSQEPK